MKQTQYQENESKTSDRQQRVQERAYELFLKRGQEPGHELEDWLQAEREIRGATTRQNVR